MKQTILSATLPQVGEKLTRIMTGSKYDPTAMYHSEDCVVVYVNRAHYWYEVVFQSSGIRECYKLPVFNHDIFTEAWCSGSIPVVCIETGEVYSSINECAKAMKLDRSGISRQLRGDCKCYNGYHFDTIIL